MKHFLRATIAIAVLVFTAQAQNTFEYSLPKTWWPDPATGLMWTGTAVNSKHGVGLNWQQATDGCKALQLGGYTGWRLPDLQEIRDLSFDRPARWRHWPFPVEIPDGQPEVTPTFKGHVDQGVRRDDNAPNIYWTTTPGDNDTGEKDYVFNLNGFTTLSSLFGKTYNGSSRTDHFYHRALCVRSMEPNLLKAANAATTPMPVESLEQLSAVALMVDSEIALAKNDFKGALDSANRAQEKDQTSWRAKNDLGVAQANLGQWSVAVKTQTEAYKSFNAAHKYIGAPRYFAVTDRTFAHRGEKEAARDPNFLPAYNALTSAEYAFRIGDYEASYAAAKRSAEAEPGWPGGYFDMGRAAAAMGQWDDAVLELQAAKKHDAVFTTATTVEDLAAAKYAQRESLKPPPFSPDWLDEEP